jgi:hypothetical protein
MKVEVAKGIEELKRHFSSSAFKVTEDGAGGAYVVIETVPFGPRFRPDHAWLGFQIPAQYPYADIYPIFVGTELNRADGRVFAVPVTRGHNFQGRAAIQVSRRNGAAQNGLQKVTAKVLKVLDFLERLP